MRISKMIITMGLTALLFSCSINMTAQNQEEWKTLSSSEYSIKYPGDWKLDQSGTMGTKFIFLSVQSSQQDQFRENVNLLIQDLKGLNIDLNKFTEISENQIRTGISNSKITESNDYNSNGVTFHKMIYTGDQGLFKLKFVQYYWVKNEKAYILTFTSEVNQFEKYRIVGEQILKSFSLK